MIIVFACGLIAGIMFTVIGGTVYGSYLDKQDKATIKKSIKDIELIGSVKYRFTKVNEITDQQLDLISRTERPSASAAHSKSKNDIVGQIKALEEEKITIFRSILADGLDPKLQIMVDGKPQVIKMSEAVAMHEGTAPFPTPETEPMKPRMNGLRLVQNSEEVNESGDQEIPGTRS